MFLRRKTKLLLGCNIAFLVPFFFSALLFSQEAQKRTIKAAPSVFQYRQAFLFTDTSGVSVRGVNINFRPIKGRSVIGEVYGRGKRYSDGYAAQSSGGADIVREVTESGIKETIIVRDAGVSLSFDYEVSGAEFYFDGSVIRSEDVIIVPPIAWDSLGHHHPATYKLLGDTIRYSVVPNDTFAITYPLYIDPTLIIKPDAAAGVDGGGLSTNYTLPLGSLTYVDIEGSTAQNSWMAITFTVPQISSDSIMITAVCSLYSSLSAAAGGEDYIACRINSYSDIEAVSWYIPPSYDTTNSYFAVPRLTATGWNVISHDTLTNWINNAAHDSANWHGFVLRPVHFDVANRNYNRYSTSDNGTASERPSLTVEYISTSPGWAPQPPDSVWASDGDSAVSIVVSWSSTDSVASYTVFASDTAGGTYDEIVVTTDTFIVDYAIDSVSVSGIPYVLADNGYDWSRVKIETSWAGITVNGGSRRHYKVKANNSDGSSALSASDSGYTYDVLNTSGFKVFRSASGSGHEELLKSGQGYISYDSTAPSPTLAAPNSVSATINLEDTIRVSWSGSLVSKGTSKYYSAVATTMLGITSDTSLNDEGYKKGFSGGFRVDTAATGSGSYAQKAYLPYGTSPYNHLYPVGWDSVFYKISLIAKDATTGNDTVSGQSVSAFGFTTGDSGTIVFSFLTDSTGTIAISGDLVKYGVMDSSLARVVGSRIFIDSLGDTTFTAILPFTSGGSATIGMLRPDTINMVALLATTISGDTILFVDTDTTWTDPVPPSLRVSRSSRWVANVFLNPMTNPSYTEFAIQDSVSGLFINWENARYTVDTAWATYDNWGSSRGFRFRDIVPWEKTVFHGLAKRSN